MSRPVTSVQFVCTCNSQITRRHSRQRKFWAIIVMLYTRSMDYNQRPRVYIRSWPCKDEELHLPYIIKCGSVRTNSVNLLGVPNDPRNHFSNYKKKCINIYYNSGQKIASELLSENS